MFKSKVDFNAFDKNNDKVKNPEPNQSKSLTKAGVKKLANSEGEKTPFHMILEYFKDDKGKVLGDFFDLGINKKLSKHFEQVEMKSGKLDKSMADSPKKAASGQAYVKIVNGEKVLHIEPDEKAKVPKGQWPKILKKFKAHFAGMKAVVVFAGEVVEEIVEEVTGGSDDTATDSTGTSDAAEVANTIKNLMVELADSMKNKVKEVAGKVKAKNVSTDDKSATDTILAKFKELEENFNNAADAVKNRMQANYDGLIKYVPQVEKIQNAIDVLLGNKAEEGTNLEEQAESEEVKALQALLKKVQEEVGKFEQNFDKIQSDLEKEDSEPIEGGKGLLNKLF